MTVTYTGPATVSGGLLTTIALAVRLVMLVAATAPKSTVALSRFAPAIVTVVPPVVGPDAGLMCVTTGAAT